MSLTLTPVRNGEDTWGRTKVTLFDVTLDTSYPLTAGYVVNAQDVGLKNILSARVEGGNKAAGAVLPVFDFGAPAGVPATSTILRLFLPTGGATAPATLTAPVVAVAEGAITVTNGAITAGAITMGGTAALTAGGDTVSIAAGVPAAGLTATAANPTQATSTATIAAGSGTLTAGIGKEVGDTTNVSSITVRVRFFGF